MSKLGFGSAFVCENNSGENGSKHLKRSLIHYCTIGLEHLAFPVKQIAIVCFIFYL